jgi:hypothetical protein
MSVKGVIDARCHSDRKSKASAQRKFRHGSLEPKEQAFELFFRTQQENCLQSLLILRMQRPVKEHGPRSVNAHSVICAPHQ